MGILGDYMQTSPQFFKVGPSPLAQLFFFVLLSVAIMVADTRSDFVSEARRVIGSVISPLQKLAYLPFSLQDKLDQYIEDFRLIEDIDHLRKAYLTSRHDFFRLQALTGENERLRALLGAAKQTELQPVLAEILYTPRDPFSRKITLDKGDSSGIKPGQVVIDDLGVIGQVTQVFPWTSEVTLITDKNHMVPVQIDRNGLRTVISGAGKNSELELRFLSINTDIQEGDLLSTSGIGGVYPSSLPVGRVVHIEYDRSHKFARIICAPVAGVDRHRQVLILIGSVPTPVISDNPEPHAPQKNQKTRNNGT